MSKKSDKPDYSKFTIERLRELLQKHQAARPMGDLFSDEMKEWLDTKSKISFHLDLKVGESRTAWHPASGPSPTGHPAAGPAVAATAKIRKPSPVPPAVEPAEVPTTPVLKPLHAHEQDLEAGTTQPTGKSDGEARARLEQLIGKMNTYISTCQHASSRAAFRVARQGVYQARFDILQLTRKHKLPIPTFPSIPNDPFGGRPARKRTGMNPAADQAPTPQVA